MTIAIKPESIREPTCACGQGVACDGGSPLKRAASMTAPRYRSTADGPRTDRVAHRCRAMRFHCAEKQATRRPCARSCRRLGRVSVI